MTNIHRETIMRLGFKIGQGCMRILDETMTDLPCDLLELDEIWDYVGNVRGKAAQCQPSLRTVTNSLSDSKNVQSSQISEITAVRGGVVPGSLQLSNP